MLLWPFNKYPGTDYETFNWEWLIRLGKKWENIWDNVVKLVGDAEDAANRAENAAEDAEYSASTINRPYVTPEQFGAIGDGIADDTEALQNALDSGQIVVLQNKVYRITRHLVISKPVIMIGMDPETCVISNDSADHAIVVKLETVEKRHVYLRNFQINGNNLGNAGVFIYSGIGYYLANFEMENVKTVDNTTGFYLNGVTADNLFLCKFAHCIFEDGFYANNIGDTVHIVECQFAYRNGVYINQVNGASSLLFENNNVTCENGFILDKATSPLVTGNIFEYSRPCNNQHGFVEINTGNTSRQLSYEFSNNVFSYRAGFNNPNKPLVYFGYVLLMKFSKNSLSIKEGNVSAVISANCHMLQWDSVFGADYASELFRDYAMTDNGYATMKTGVYWNRFINGLAVNEYYMDMTGKLAVSASTVNMAAPLTLTASNNIGVIRYGEYVDKFTTQNNTIIANITPDGFLPLNLLIGGVSNHCRIMQMGGTAPTDPQRGDLYINKYQTTDYDGYLYFYNGSTLVKLA